MGKKPIFIILIVFFSTFGFGQIMQPGQPLSNKQELRKEVIFSSFQQKNIIPDANSKLNGQPLLAGYTLPFFEKISPEWEETKDKQFVSRVGISVQNAKAINVYFSNFDLKKDDKLFIYNSGKKQIIGALSEANNGEFLSTAFIASDSLIIELNSNKKTTNFPFEINEIGVSINDIYQTDRGFGDAGSCEILVNCPEGEDWQKEKKGVARVLVKEGSSLYWCSGSLVNNTRQDGTPYFLTANHCGVDASTADYNQWIFYFQYESPDCQFPMDEPTLQSMTGAKKISNASEGTSGGSDFKLLLLNEEVPKNYQPYFNGWNRSVSPANSGVDIHHPEGDLKMISTYLTPVASTDYLSSTPNPNGHYWEVIWSQTDGGYGVTEGGSSGSPLFNSQGQIIGALTGGRASCSNQDAPDYFGKLSYSWDSNGIDSASQLSVWLAPDNAEIESLNGTDLDTIGLTADFRAEFTNILVGETANFINNSSGKISEYRWYFIGGSPDFSETEQPPTIQYNSAGNFDVKLEVSSSSGQNQITRYQYIRVMPSISPNLGTGLFTINFGNKVPEDLQIEVFDINGQKMQFSIAGRGTSGITIDISVLSDGVYFIRTETPNTVQTIKVLLSK